MLLGSSKANLTDVPSLELSGGCFGAVPLLPAPGFAAVLGNTCRQQLLPPKCDWVYTDQGKASALALCIAPLTIL